MKTRTLILLTSLALLVAACGTGAANEQAAIETQVAALMTSQASEGLTAPQEPTSASGDPQTTADPLLPSLPAEAACIPANAPRVLATVTEVYAGDAILVEVDGQDHDVRYIGVDSGDLPIEINRGLVEGKQVLLIMDTTDVDEYGRWPRYVIADGVFVNFELVRRGGAYVSLEAPDLACERDFKDLRQ